MNQPQRCEQKEKDLENVYHMFTHTHTHHTHIYTHHTLTSHGRGVFVCVCVCVSGVFLHVCLYAWRMFFNISTCYGLGLSTVEIKYQNIKIHDLKEG